MRNWRFSISLDGGITWQDSEPLNGSKLSITFSRDLDAGQVFFRRKLSGKPILGGAAYEAINAIRRDASKRCFVMLMRAERACGQRQEAWRGRFTTTGCAWDFDACTVTVDPQTVDRYTCILDAMERKVNLLRAATTTVVVPFVLADLEVHACTACSGDEFCQPSGDPLDPTWAWKKIAEIPFQVGTPPLAESCMSYAWGRMRRTTECVGGNPAPPQGSGWVMISDDCDSNSTSTWVRELTDDEVFLLNAQFTSGICADGVAQPPDCEAYQQVFPCGAMTTDGTPNGEIDHLWLCYGSAGILHSRCRSLQDAIKLVLEESGCGIALASDFFEWDAVGDAPGYLPGINYVTGSVNELAHLMIEQKSDAIDPYASNPATRGEATLGEMLAWLRAMFRCWWDIDDDGRMRIEHWSYWKDLPSIDILTEEGLIEPLRVSQASDQIPRAESLRMMEADGADFAGVAIAYPPACATAAEMEHSAGRITTDIAYIASAPEAVSKDGFVIYACVPSSAGFACIVSIGALSGNFAVNAPLSVANLQDAYWRHDRHLPTGRLNRIQTDFEDWLPMAKQDGVSFRFCCSSLDFNPSRPVNGRLARRLGMLGAIDEATLNLYTDRLSLVLKYPT